MEDVATIFRGNWQDWLTVLGYIAFAGVIMWRVFTTDKK